MFYLKLPFDKLQESATKITNGDLDTEIFVIEKGIGEVVEFAPGVYAKPIEEDVAREIIMAM